MADPEASSPSFSDPGFNTTLHELHGQAAFKDAENESREETAESAEDNCQETLERLNTISSEVAQAANENTDLAEQKITFYRQQRKGRGRRFMGLRGEHDHAEATQGWVIYPASSASLKKSPDRANLFNSGVGLMLTEDGKLHLYLAQHGVERLPKDPLDAYHATADRFKLTDRRAIERHTFVPKDEFKPLGIHITGMPEKTFLPRYRPEQDRPTLLLALDDPNNQLANKHVVKQCYDALAKFVQQNLPLPEDTVSTEEEPTLPQPDGLRAVENLSNEERMRQWFDEGLVVLRTQLTDEDMSRLDRKHRDESNESANPVYNDVARSAEVESEIDNQTPETIRKELSKHGLDEILTVAAINKKFNEINPDSSKSEEGVVQISYEVPRGDKAGSGNVEMHLFLPVSEARQALEMIYHDPYSIRTITERFATDHLGLDESWEEARPDYEKMKARNGGRNQMALRNGFSSGLKETSRIRF